MTEHTETTFPDEQPGVAAEAAAGVSDDLLDQVGDVMAAAGVLDMAQGADMLDASEDIQTLSLMIGMMSEEDLDRGMELARLAGELWTVSDVVALLEMPVLADFLEMRGERLQQIAVDSILRFSSTRVLSDLMAETGQRVADRGDEELTEGIARSVAAAAMTARRAAMAEAGADVTVADEDEPGATASIDE